MSSREHLVPKLRLGTARLKLRFVRARDFVQLTVANTRRRASGRAFPRRAWERGGERDALTPALSQAATEKRRARSVSSGTLFSAQESRRDGVRSRSEGGRRRGRGYRPERSCGAPVALPAS